MKRLIVNADDFGYAEGVNRGVIEAHRKGIVTSTSLQVKRRLAKEAAKLAKENPGLGVGIHFEIFDENIRSSVQKLSAVVSPERVREEFVSQIDLFKKLMGRLPTHIDSHYHIHKLPRVFPVVKEFAEKHNMPVRDSGTIRWITEFFGHPTVKKVSVENLIKILKSLPEGDSELMCHPGYVTPDIKSGYTKQREVELRSLTDPRVKEVIKEEEIELINWSQV